MGSRATETISRGPCQTDRGARALGSDGSTSIGRAVGGSEIAALPLPCCGRVLYPIAKAAYGGPCTLQCGAIDDAVAAAAEGD